MTYGKITLSNRMIIVALYKKGSSTYIKVKNSSGKYGYVKTQSTMIVKNPIYASQK